MAIEDWDTDAPWELLNCDCLGCLMDARNAGAITDDEYADILREQRSAHELETVPCPQCKGTAYISQYEPDLAHCPTCGLYSVREGLEDWTPFRQGRKWRDREANQ